MKKRLLSMLLALAMLLTLAPSAWAASADESKFDGLYRPNPNGNAVYLGKGPDGVMEFERTIPVGGNVRNPLTDDSAVHFSNNSSDESVVYFPNPKQYIGKAPGTAVLSFFGYINDSNANKLWARLTVTVLSKEDFETYQQAASAPVDGHSHVWRKQSTLPTCGQTGQLVNRCAVCGQEEFIKTLEKLPHSYSYAYDKSNNQNVYTCPYCGDRYTVPVNSQNPTATINPTNPGTSTPTNPQPSTPVEPQKPHTHDYSSEVTKAATANQTGIRTYTCKICGDSYTEPIPSTKVITTGTPISQTVNSKPVKSHNINTQNYSDNASSPVKSHLIPNNSGGLTRVEFINNEIVVENYSSSFELQSSWSTQPELPKWGGFYSGENYNFIVFGQENNTENKSTEVIRVVQYTKDWKRINSASLYGANTKDPFAGGSLRFAEWNGYLYIHTCHAMFKSDDGVNHQANLTFSVRQSDMTIADSYYEISNIRTGYVSHSFNQFLLVDQSGKLVTLDHGDTYPRALVVVKYHSDLSNGIFTGEQRVWGNAVNVLEFPGAAGDNATGCSVGGFEETSNGYVMAYSYDGKGGAGGTRDMYLSFTSKNLSASNQVKLSTGVKVTAPQVVSTGLSGGYVMWNEQGGKEYGDATIGGKLYYTTYDSAGKAGTVKTATAPLSDCKPLVFNGKVIWYVTSDTEPVFYILDSSGVTSVNTAPPKTEQPGATTQQPGTTTQQPGTTTQQPGTVAGTFTDVPAGAFFAEPVAWAVERGITNGTSTTTFSPYQQCTQVQILTFLWRAAGEPASSNALPISIAGKNIDYAETALRWASENNMIDSGFVPNKPCTRASAVKFIWQAFGSPTTMTWTASGGYQTSSSSFSDVSANFEYADAVSWAVDEGVTTGTSNTTFSPNDICNRGQIVTFLYRAYH